MSMQKISEKKLNIAGVLLLLVSFLPAFLLREGSVILVGDQLDGEIFTYIYGAEYLFSGSERIAEYMGGIHRAALFPPSVLTVLLYRVTKPLTAFLINQVIVAVTAFLGMNALLKKLDCNQWTAFVTAGVFSFLPFYSVYGLSVAGIPMLLWAFIQLYEESGKRSKEQKDSVSLLPLLLICLYVPLSSFVLIGFAVTGCLWVYGIFLCCTKKRKQYGSTYFSILFLTMLYLFINHDLVQQVHGIGETQISHKSEYVLHAQPFFQTAWNLFVNGSGHAPSFHSWMILPVLAGLLWGAVKYKKLSKKQKRQYRILSSCFAATVLIALFYGAFHAEAIVTFRQKLGGFFVYFQLDRIYWFYPVLWYVMLGMLCELLPALFLTGRRKEQSGGKQDWIALSGRVAAGILFGISALTVLWQSDLKKNVRQLLSPSTSHAVTWEKYYGPEIFAQIAAFIEKEQSEYRVACVGLNPAVAAYNGFYTVDGYSNNYELSYKHAFREVIADELEKDAALKQYFDDWGNRCYLFSAQLGQEYYFEKDSGVSIKELRVDTGKLKELGCEYVFAGVPVENAEELGWTLEGTFEAEVSDCRYCIRVYRIG